MDAHEIWTAVATDVFVRADLLKTLPQNKQDDLSFQIAFHLGRCRCVQGDFPRALEQWLSALPHLASTPSSSIAFTRECLAAVEAMRSAENQDWATALELLKLGESGVRVFEAANRSDMEEAALMQEVSLIRSRLLRCRAGVHLDVARAAREAPRILEQTELAAEAAEQAAELLQSCGREATPGHMLACVSLLRASVARFDMMAPSASETASGENAAAVTAVVERLTGHPCLDAGTASRLLLQLQQSPHPSMRQLLTATRDRLLEGRFAEDPIGRCRLHEASMAALVGHAGEQIRSIKFGLLEEEEDGTRREEAVLLPLKGFVEGLVGDLEQLAEAPPTQEVDAVKRAAFSSLWNLAFEHHEGQPHIAAKVFALCEPLLLAGSVEEGDASSKLAAVHRAIGLCLLQAGDFAGALERAEMASKTGTAPELSTLVLGFEASLSLSMQHEAANFMHMIMSHPAFTAKDASGILVRAAKNNNKQAANECFNILMTSQFALAVLPDAASNPAAPSVPGWIACTRVAVALAIHAAAPQQVDLSAVSNQEGVSCPLPVLELVRNCIAVISSRREEFTAAVGAAGREGEEVIECLQWLFDVSWNAALALAKSEEADYLRAGQAFEACLQLSLLMGADLPDRRMEDRKMASVLSCSAFMQHVRVSLTANRNALESPSDLPRSASLLLSTVEDLRQLSLSARLSLEQIHLFAQHKARAQGGGVLSGGAVSQLVAQDKAFPLVRLIEAQAKVFTVLLAQWTSRLLQGAKAAPPPAVEEDEEDMEAEGAAKRLKPSLPQPSTLLATLQEAERILRCDPLAAREGVLPSEADVIAHVRSLQESSLSGKVFEVVCGMCMDAHLRQAADRLLSHLRHLAATQRDVRKLATAFREQLELKADHNEAEALVDDLLKAANEAGAGAWPQAELLHQVQSSWNRGVHYYKLHNFLFAERWLAKALKFLALARANDPQAFSDHEPKMVEIYGKCSQMNPGHTFAEQAVY